MNFDLVVITSKPTTQIPSQKVLKTLAPQNQALVPSLRHPYPTDGAFTLYRLTILPLLYASHPPTTSILPNTIR